MSIALDDDEAWSAHRQAFAETLGQAKPVSSEVLSAALNDELYAQRLMATRSHPGLLKLLLDNPPPPSGPDDHSSLRLLGKAAVSFARWGAQGFATVDEATLHRRRSACDTCEHARRAPDTPLYRLSGKLGGAICALCGCNLAVKTRFPHEACPGADPERPGFNRWGDAVAVAEPSAPAMA